MSSPKSILVLNATPPRTSAGLRRSVRLLPRLRVLPLVIKLLKWLGFEFVTLSAAAKARSGRFACVTFDGGYRNFIGREQAFLVGQGIPATVLISTGEVGKRKIVAKALGFRHRTSTLSWKELGELVKLGWEIGTSGHSYLNLTEKSHSLQHAQITKAKRAFETHLGREPRVFAYPYGAADAGTIKLLREEGFEVGLTMVQRSLMLNGTEKSPDALFRVGRFSLDGLRLGTWIKFAQELFATRSLHQLQSATRADVNSTSHTALPTSSPFH